MFEMLTDYGYGKDTGGFGILIARLQAFGPGKLIMQTPWKLKIFLGRGLSITNNHSFIQN